MTLPASVPSSKPSVVAALWLLALEHLRAVDDETWPRTASQAIRLAGASKSQAYTMRGRLLQAMDDLERPVGRPPKPAEPDAVRQVLVAVRDHLIKQPGAAVDKGVRHRYAESFRAFVLQLLSSDGPGAQLTVEQASEATGVPAGTLKEWLQLDRPETTAPQPADAPAQTPPADPADDDDVTACAGHPHIATLIAEYQTWKGDFSAFCEHARNHLRLPYGRTFIGTVLQAAGLRTPSRRKQPPPPWSRDSFRRLFPGAQWLGDGTSLAIQVGDQRFVFNLEAICDVDSGALVGVHVSDAEDEAALLSAFEHGVTTTGDKPVALTVDARPSNHTPGVTYTIAPTTLLSATPGRGQAKAGIEGAFGLFSQTAPPLRVEGNSPRALARAILALVVTTWAWARNGKPRPRLDGRSPADHYRKASPTDEQLEAARAWTAELRRRHELAQRTAARRADPVRRALLDEQIAKLGLDDPEGRLAVGLARYSIEAILRGLATFKTKLQMNTIPDDADRGRYLGGIIRNLNLRTELDRTAQYLLELRLRHRDLCLHHLEAQVAALRRTSSSDELPTLLVQRALEAERTVDVRFYTTAARQALADLPAPVAAACYRRVAHQAAAAFSADKQRREDLVAALSAGVVQSRP